MFKFQSKKKKLIKFNIVNINVDLDLNMPTSSDDR